MKKITKELLTGVMALGLVAPVATQTLVHNPRITVNAKRRAHRHYRRGSHKRYRNRRTRRRRGHKRVRRTRAKWHYGVPKAIKGYWRSKLARSNQYYHHGYMRLLVYVNRNNYGFNPFPFWYNAKKHYKMNGATNGEFWHPHYKYLGHGKYVITSGDAFNGHSYSMKYYIQKHGARHFTMRYWNSDNNKIDYGGYFTKANTRRQWLRA